MATPKRRSGSNDWSAVGYWDTGAAPASTDNARLEEGGDIITVGVANPAVNLTGLYVGPNFTGSVDGLVIDVNQGGTGVFEYNGSGERFGISGGNTGVIAKLVHRAMNGRTRLNVDGVTTVTLAELIAGMLVIASTATVPTLKCMSGSCMVLYNIGNASTNIIAGGNSRVVLQRDWTGTLTVEDEASVDLDLYGGNGMITGGAVVQTGGLIKWLNGNLGALTLRGGTLDYSAIRSIGLSAGAVEEWSSAMELQPKNATWMPSFGARTLVGGGSQKQTK